MKEQEKRCSNVQELEGKLLGTLNSFINDMHKSTEEFRGSITTEVNAMKAELNKIKGDLALCKATMTIKGIASIWPKLKVPEPPSIKVSGMLKSLTTSCGWWKGIWIKVVCIVSTGMY